MHFRLERTVNTECDCPISVLSWMGRVPDQIPESAEGVGWKLNRMFYYQEGWLAVGTMRGVVGVTYTTSQTAVTPAVPTRTNYNLRGHRGEIVMAKWNEPYQKLATCDASGIIFVWVKFEGRWSIELINDRCIAVTHFEWSHDGKMALICYQDGFVLVGSVSGQRYWSLVLNLDSTITSGVFCPDDQQVLLGTSSGLLVVMDVHGVTQSQESLLEGVSITGLMWSCPKFKMEDTDDSRPKTGYKYPALLTVMFETGLIYLMKSTDDPLPIVIETNLNSTSFQWNVTGEYLVVTGHTCQGSWSPKDPIPLQNYVKFYTRAGTIRLVYAMESNEHPLSGMAWGHHDKRLFLATGNKISIGQITRKMSSLSLKCRIKITDHIHNEKDLAVLPLPRCVRRIMTLLYSHTFRCHLPTPKTLLRFTSRPPPEGKRLHCTMIRHDEDPEQPHAVYYTLYIEYLGGLMPLLKGKRNSKLRPEFVIFDPEEYDSKSVFIPPSPKGGRKPMEEDGGLSDYTESEDEEPSTPRPGKSSKKKKKAEPEEEEEQEYEYLYQDLLPEKRKIAEVTSNIWGTKFKIHGLDPCFPCNLGEITYKTSLLHLQPRQMSLIITELRDDCSLRSDPNFNPNSFSEDEDEQAEKHQRPRDLDTNTPAIAPLTPRRDPSSYSSQDLLSPVVGPWDVPKQARELVSNKTSKWDDHAYVDLFSAEVDGLTTALRAQRNASDDKRHKTHVQSPLASCNDTNNTPSTFSSGPSRAAESHSCSNNQPSSTPTASHSHTSSSYCRKPSPLRIDIRKTTTQSCAKESFRYIDDESGESESGSLSPSPFHKLHNRSRARSKSVGHLLNISDESCKQVPQPSSHLHQLTSLEAFMAFRRSLSLKDCKKQRQVVAEVEHPRLIDFGKSHSLDSSLLMLDCKSVSLTESPGNNKLHYHLESHKNSSTLHSSPNRMHVIRNPSHSSHIYENINIYASSFSKAHKKERSSPQHSKGEKKQIKAQPPSRSLVAQLQKNSINATKHGSNPSSPKHKLHSPPTPPTSSRLADNKFIRGLKEVMLGETFVSLYRDCSSPQPGSTCSSPSPENGRKTITKPCVSPAHSSHSSPSTPSKRNKHRRHQSASPVRCDSPAKSRDFEWRNLFSSPLLSRRRQRRATIESSDEENCSSDQEAVLTSNFSNLENFQKTQLKNKLRRNRGRDTIRKSKVSSGDSSTTTAKPRKFYLQNKAPIWNDLSQVYQLDFGGRVTQESAKNFQIEFRGKQVMQFGRIDSLSYTLDFQYPFSAVQAFAVALANVTQRLK